MYFGRDLRDATQRVYDQMYALSDQILHNGGVLSAFSQTSAWILGIGTPVYTTYAHVVGDILGGSYLKLASDARTALLATVQVGATMGKQIAESITVHVEASLKNIKMPAIAMPSLGAMPGGDILAQFAGPLKQIMQIFGNIGGFFHGIFQPFIDEWNRVKQELLPSFIQFGMWWQKTMGPIFAQFADGAKGAKSPLKELLDIFGNLVIFVAKFGMIFIEHVLPGVMQGVGWLLTHLQPLLDFFLNFTGWLSTTGIDMIASFFNNIGPLIGGLLGKLGEIKDTVGNVLGWIGDHIGPAVQTWKNFLSGFGQFVSSVWGGITGDITGVLNGIIGQVDIIISAIDRISVDTPFGHVGFSIPLIPFIMNGSRSTGVGASIPSFASGVENFTGGLAFVHAGEALVNMPSGTSVKQAGSFGGGHTFNLTINAGASSDPNALAALMRREFANMMRNHAVLPNISSGGRL
jgi:hypothetical protein